LACAWSLPTRRGDFHPYMKRHDRRTTRDAPIFGRGISPKQAFGLQLPFTESVTSNL
jgi:hypothetical protein